MCHDKKAFVTLTYDDEHLPEKGDLQKRDLQLYCKRVYRRVEGGIRYYGCGEYGERYGRPHYHLAVYGEEDVDLLSTAWGQGKVDVGFLEPASAAYICGYMVKKFGERKRTDRVPEFAVMSLKPGLGTEYVEEIAKALWTKGGAAYISREGDIPRVLRFDGKQWPLSRYMRDRVREAMGMDEKHEALVAFRAAVRRDVKVLEAGSVKAFVEREASARINSARRARFFESVREVRKEL